MDIEIKETKEINKGKVIKLYEANKWSSAKSLGNAISDGYLVVYYPHLLVHPDYQGKGIGRMIFNRFQKNYGNFHQQTLTADGKVIDFYRKCGFEKAGSTQSMWIYQGDEHN